MKREGEEEDGDEIEPPEETGHGHGKHGSEWERRRGCRNG